MTRIAGVDDAGRGPVIGPLVVAATLFHDHQIPNLRTLGIKDSKLLTPNRRFHLSNEIREIALDHVILEFKPSEIDKVVLKGKKLRRLNWYEAKAMAQVIRRLKPEIAYVDASDVNAKRFGHQISEMLPFKARIVSEHHADSKYVVVAAASIIAKVHRDEVISSLREEYGDFGSGYSSDPKTIRFLACWIKEKGDLPNIVRKSWKTIKRLKEEQKTS